MAKSPVKGKRSKRPELRKDRFTWREGDIVWLDEEEETKQKELVDFLNRLKQFFNKN